LRKKIWKRRKGREGWFLQASPGRSRRKKELVLEFKRGNRICEKNLYGEQSSSSNHTGIVRPAKGTCVGTPSSEGRKRALLPSMKKRGPSEKVLSIEKEINKTKRKKRRKKRDIMEGGKKACYTYRGRGRGGTF